MTRSELDGADGSAYPGSGGGVRWRTDRWVVVVDQGRHRSLPQEAQRGEPARQQIRQRSDPRLRGRCAQGPLARRRAALACAVALVAALEAALSPITKVFGNSARRAVGSALECAVRERRGDRLADRISHLAEVDAKASPARLGLRPSCRCREGPTGGSASRRKGAAVRSTSPSTSPVQTPTASAGRKGRSRRC